jgi:quinol monooxygenase YgiN
MIHVIATIQLKPNTRDAFLNAFHKLVPSVLEEVGCIEYGPTIDATTDLDKQAVKGDDSVTVIEKWESLAALKDHLVAPHMAPYREAVKDLVEGSTLHILEPA